MYNIQILNKISPNGLDVFDKNKYRISDCLLYTSRCV